MHTLIRVDSSARMGTGHLVRCLTLAEALRERGWEVMFVCRAHPGDQSQGAQAAGFPVLALPVPPATEATNPAAADDYPSWLGVSEAQDAQETIAALSQTPSPFTQHEAPSDSRPLLIVDHYALGASWERALRPYVDRILAIDDLANRPHDCDFLLDQNYAPGHQTRYSALAPPTAHCLFGPRYALLRPEYRRQREAMGPRRSSLHRILVYFGGTDPHDCTGRALQALHQPGLEHLEVDLVVGANYPYRPALEEKAIRRGRATVHGPRPHLADLMTAADLAIGAGGATTWERCCLGLPSLVVSIAENQRPACEALAVDGVIGYLGTAAETTVDRLSSRLLALARDPASLGSMSAAGRRLVDGEGAKRVVEALHQHAPAVP